MNFRKLVAQTLADSNVLRGAFVAMTGPYKRLPDDAVTGARVDQYYQSGEWAGMRSFADFGRYGALAEWIRRLAPHGPVLDVGAGDGLMAAALQGLDIEYDAIELAPETVKAMQEQFGSEKRRFLVGDADTYAPERRYPIILFNDMLYYLQKPVQTMKRICGALEPDGTVIVTMYMGPRQIRLLDAILKSFDLVERIYFVNAHRQFVHLALKPRLGGQAEASLRDNAYLKRLDADLARWSAAGTISPAQAEAARADARTHLARPAGSFANVAAALGAVLFGLGIITFIGANWDVLPKAARLVAVIALLWLAFGGAVRAIERKNEGMEHALALIGALAMGGAIALIGQTYHIEGSASGLLIPWAFGVLLAALCFSSRALLVLYVILAFLYFAFDRPGDFFLDRGPSTSPGLALFGVFYLPLLAIGAWLGRRWDSGAAMHLSGLAGLAWLVLLFMDSVWLGEKRDFIAAGCMLAAAGGGLAALNEIWRMRTHERAASIWLSWSCGAVLVGIVVAEIALHDKKILAVEMVFAAAALALSVWAINWGEAPGRKAVRVFAVLLFAFECFFIYFALFGDMMFTAQFLLGAGALLLAVAYALRRMTRPDKPAEALP